jgi:uncharacterized protein (TIGR03083 family)
VDVADLYEAVAGRRRDLADALDGLTPDQWDAPSLCEGWRTRDVVVHLLMGPEISTPSFLGLMVKNRFDFNRVNDVVAKRDTRTPDELVAALRTHAEDRFHPPLFGPEAPLTDLTVHSGDILRPLGLPHPVPEPDARVVLDLVSSSKGQAGFGKRGRLDGLGFAADDLDWSQGDGLTITGPAEALIMAMCGRAAALDDLEGEGVATLRSRV